MKNPLKSPASTSLGLLLARVPVGLLFIKVAYFKFNLGVGNFVNMSLDSAKKYMGEPAGRAFLYAVPSVEMLIGVLFILGLFTRTIGLIASLLLTSIMISTTGMYDQNTFVHNNVIYFGVTLLMFFAGAGDFSLDGLWSKRGGKSKVATA